MPASATMRISEDRGGQIGQYLRAYSVLRSSGEHVVIDGDCLSACTLILGMIPRDRICATPRAVLGFHAAWMPGRDGQPVTSMPGTRELWKVYPWRVRRWIDHHGGLSRQMIYLHGHDLYSIVPSCASQEVRRNERPRRILARAHSRYRHRRLLARSHSLRYQRAAAANDRR
ncbi:MAG TPA: hypothetical protein VE224_09000 [Pseudolabrys sp.]|nr:hypothetical protein [Pseudolabrys sp.]